MDTFLSLLRDTFRGDVHTDQKILDRFSRDTSIFAVTPQLVVSPLDAADVVALVSSVRQARADGIDISLTARSGGTDMTGGPLSESVVVDCSHLNRIRTVSATDATTEPGVYYRDFEEATLAHGVIFPSFPASREICAMGGIVMNNAGGEKTLAYGKTADYVMSATLVLDDGESYTFTKLTADELAEKKALDTREGDIYRRMDSLIRDNASLITAHKPHTTKNSSGYALWDVIDTDGSFDLTRVITGSQGTLGLLTEVQLRLVQPKEHTTMLVVFLTDLTQLGEITRVLRSHNPETIESYDDKTLGVAVKYIGDIFTRLKGNLLTLGFSFLPEAWMVLTGGMPKLVITSEFTADTAADAKAKATAAEAALREFGYSTRVTKNERENEKYRVIRRESFNLLRKHTKNLRTVPFIDDIVVHPDHLSEFLPKLYEILAEYEDHMTYTIAGHIGDGNFHIIPLMNLSNTDSVTIIKDVLHKVYKLVSVYDGSITGEHNDGLIRSWYLPQMFGAEMHELFENTKEIFDPQNIFNPGKKVGAQESYAFDHIDTAGDDDTQ